MKITTITKVTPLYAIALLAISCTNPASSDDDHKEHTEPYGLELVMNGQTVIEYFDGEVTGQLNIQAGEKTSLITIHFLNEEGQEIHDEDFDDEYSLGWEIQNEDVIGIEQHYEDGRWSFHLVGKSAGTSTIQFQLLHAGHSDFETPAVDQQAAIQVTVEEPAS